MDRCKAGKDRKGWAACKSGAGFRTGAVESHARVGGWWWVGGWVVVVVMGCKGVNWSSKLFVSCARRCAGAGQHRPAGAPPGVMPTRPSVVAWLAAPRPAGTERRHPKLGLPPGKRCCPSASAASAAAPQRCAASSCELHCSARARQSFGSRDCVAQAAIVLRPGAVLTAGCGGKHES